MAGITSAQLRAVLFATENGNDGVTLQTFSYAGGASTYSFGLLQFDVGSNHGNVQNFLLENGFSQAQIARLSRQGGLTKPELGVLNAQLGAIPRRKLEAYTDTQLAASVERIGDLIADLKVAAPSIARALGASTELQLALADYDNQFGIEGIGVAVAPRNGMRSFLEGNQVRLPGGTLQLNGRLDREDIQAFINATGYGINHPRSVVNREQRLVAALSDLGLDAHIGTSMIAEASDSRNGLLRAGVKAPEAVRLLQTRLARLGYQGADGKPLDVDGAFGPATQGAVVAFQQTQGLVPDGLVGPATSQAIELALARTELGKKATGLDDPSHPGHGMYQQARTCIHCLDRQHGRAPDHHSDNLSGFLAAIARAHGLASIDHVVLGNEGNRAWAVEGDLRSPFKRAVDVDVMQGLTTPLCQSSEAFDRTRAVPETTVSSPPSEQTIMLRSR